MGAVLFAGADAGADALLPQQASRRREPPQSGMCSPRALLLLLLCAAVGAEGQAADSRGPRFSVEPPSRLLFANSSGARLDCAAHGAPPPRVQWLLASDGSPVSSVPGARNVLANGSLLFPPFRGEHFRPDVHSSSYRCSASNSAGRIVSPDVLVRAEVEQPYEARVYDVQVLPGNTAVFRCHIPSFVRDLLTVTSWLQDRTFNIYPITEGGAKQVMLPSGELYVVDTAPEDSLSQYRCRTLHRLTGKTQESVTAGRLQVIAAKGPVAPQITEKGPSTIVARAGEDVAIQCVAQGSPPPQYWWFREREGRLEPLRAGPGPGPGARLVLVGGSLLLRGAAPQDSGLYVCAANSSAGAASLEARLRVLPALTARLSPVNLRVDAADAAVFECVTPAKQITWLKDGQQLPLPMSEVPSRLVIPVVQREDQGMYQCLVHSEGDSVQATAELRLGASPPQLLYKFIEQTLQPGPDVSLKCVATGQPTPQISWTLDGFPLPQSDRFMIGQYVTAAGDVISHVNISRVAPEDGGTYTCDAANRMGHTTHSAPLRIYGAPIVRKMPPISAVAGDRLIVMCPAAGYPIHSIIWEKEGRHLPINKWQSVADNGTLIINNVQQSTDQGTFTCEARGRQGHVARGSVAISVMEPPSIYPFSIENNARLGERLGLQCLVTKGDSPLGITWLKDNTNVLKLHLPSLTVRELGAFSSALLIERLSTIHEGTYTCQASNAAATASHSVMLAVNVPPEITPFAFPELSEGGRIQVPCTVHQGDLPLNLTWLKDWEPLPSHVRVTNFNTYSSIVTMNNVQRGDSGNYTCLARNSARTSSYTALLAISVPPEWVIEPRDASVISGQSIALDCQADGLPQPNITWRKSHGKQSNQFDDIGIPFKNGSLIINSASEEDEGYYLCEANNGIGAGLSAVISLKVNALPSFIVPVSRETIRRGATAKLRCEANGDVPMNIAWRFNGVMISTEVSYRHNIKETEQGMSKSSELLISDVTGEDSGKYLCIATNDFGKDETVIQLLVQDVPEAPTDVQVVDCSSREIKIVWNEPPDGNSPVLYYSVMISQSPDDWPEPNETGDPRLWKRLTNLHPSTTYYIKVIAVNHLGSGIPSSISSVTTDPEAPSGAPVDITVVAIGPNVLQVSWQPPKKTLQNGPILGYYVGFMQLGSGTEGSFNFITVRADEPLPWLLQGLRSYTQYKIVVQAYNSVGAGPLSEEVVMTTLQSAPESSPVDVHCNSKSSQELEIQWASPPSGTHNGIIQGYYIKYESVMTSINFPQDDEVKTAETSSESIILDGLQKFHNYSVKVSAYTSAGMGPTSDSIICITGEDLPSSPAAVRAALSSSHSAIVAWLPPTHPNGIIIRYNVYEREIRRSVSREPSRHHISSGKNMFESNQLRDHSMYEWWVTAVTLAGEGPRSSVVALTPSSTVPASIVSFPMTLSLPWKMDVSFHCQYVGIPQPEIKWTFNMDKVETSQRLKLWPNGTLNIHNIGLPDAGNFSCYCKNEYKSDKITHRLIVLVPPLPPNLEVLNIGSNNVSLSWIRGAESTATLGYILNYRPARTLEWKEEHLPHQTKTFSLVGLDCGTEYEIAAAAYNIVGTGVLSPIIEVRTLGNKPIAPPIENAVSRTSTSITIHLEKWNDGDCYLSHFVLQRYGSNKDWITVTDHAQPGTSYTISGLEPSTFYHLRITAYNKRGYTNTEYKVSTLTQDGGINLNDINSPELETLEHPLLTDLRVSLPIAVSVLALILTLATVVLCLRKKPVSCTTTESVAAETNIQQRPEYYSALQKKPDNNRESVINSEERIPEYGDEIYPYATFQVQKQPNHVSSLRGFQTFVYQGSGLLDVDSYATHGPPADNYMHVQPSLRSDTEEYDSLGSDSDSRADERPHNFHPTYLHSNIRHSRLVSMLESSTSTEPSPMPDRRYHHKKSTMSSRI